MTREEGLKNYRALSQPPLKVLKKITGGRLNGKSDINPQWRYEAMTELYGLCGIGWRYTIDKQWIEDGEKGERMAFVNVSVYVKNGAEWSSAIPGTGGSMLVALESGGPYNSDEAYKMATTDALSVALKMIGVAADIYAGRFDGSNYITDAQPERKEPPKGEPTQAELKELWEGKIKELAAGLTGAAREAFVKELEFDTGGKWGHIPVDQLCRWYAQKKQRIERKAHDGEESVV